MKFESHLIVGFLIVVLFLVFLDGKYGNYKRIFAASVILIGSVLPDIDLPISKVRKSFRLLTFLAGFFVFLLFFSSFLANIVLVVLLSVAMSFVILFVLDSLIPYHRGPLHGISTSIFYGIFCGYLSGILGFGIIGIFGSLGYFSHIFLDIISKE